MKRELVEAILPSQRRIETAKICGWEFTASHDKCGQAYPEFWSDGESVAYAVDELPNYLHSLDAMHEAENIIGAGDLGSIYRRHLEQVCECGKSDPWYSVHATAEQRNLAFLMTLLP